MEHAGVSTPLAEPQGISPTLLCPLVDTAQQRPEFEQWASKWQNSHELYVGFHQEMLTNNVRKVLVQNCLSRTFVWGLTQTQRGAGLFSGLVCGRPAGWAGMGVWGTPLGGRHRGDGCCQEQPVVAVLCLASPWQHCCGGAGCPSAPHSLNWEKLNRYFPFAASFPAAADLRTAAGEGAVAGDGSCAGDGHGGAAAHLPAASPH